MTEEQKQELENRFRYYEKRSTLLVMILFGIIMLIHSINPEGLWKIDLVKYLFRICISLILGFIAAEFLKDLFFPMIAKFYFKERKK